ncbi:ubiA prenyltransferase domain-containing protein 1 homolog isoform X2 [Artemia franciscana]|uniref:Uncharacterized protein n=2 Tax=Artemia franciscana TaxID=6661 RepID=A0AA88KW93_ARTSF|nr:hypothetical protein QYM36_013338 [Artemia franciscana]
MREMDLISKHLHFSHYVKLSSYVESLRPWSFSASLIPVLLGIAIAYKSTGAFSIVALLLTGLCAISVHGAGNIVNTYFDYIKGIDSKKSDDRTLVDQILSIDEIVALGAFLYGCGCIGFVLLTALSPAKVVHLALVYFGGLSSSFLYTGGIGLKYIALGDVLILIIFGPVTVLFSYLAQVGQIELATIYYAIPLALNTEAILHSNNTRDVKTDSKAGIVTLAILIGPGASILLFALLLFIPYIIFMVVSVHTCRWFLLPVLTMPYAFKLEREFRQVSMQDIPQKTAKLNFIFGILYVLAILMSDKSVLPFL